jgi:hypothetical protein
LDSLTKSQEHSGKKIQIIDDCNLVVRAKISTVCMMLKKKVIVQDMYGGFQNQVFSAKSNVTITFSITESP